MTNSHTAITRQIEGLKQQTRNGMDYWMGRDLVRILGYRTWERFAQVINRARDACRSTGRDPENHFLDTGKMVEIGSGAMRERGDWFLSRYACYLIAMNGDPRKPEIGAAQTYFAVKTREKELDEDRALDERRVDLRVKATEAFKSLSKTAQDVGVRNRMQPVFHDAGYRGMYNMSRKEVLQYKGIPENESLLDRAGVLELAAHTFRMALAQDVIARKKVLGEQPAIDTHRDVGADVRQTIINRGGTVPEQLPPEPHIKIVQKRLKKSDQRKGLPKP